MYISPACTFTSLYSNIIHLLTCNKLHTSNALSVRPLACGLSPDTGHHIDTICHLRACKAPQNEELHTQIEPQ